MRNIVAEAQQSHDEENRKAHKHENDRNERKQREQRTVMVSPFCRQVAQMDVDLDNWQEHQGGGLKLPACSAFCTVCREQFVERRTVALAIDSKLGDIVLSGARLFSCHFSRSFSIRAAVAY